MPKSDLLQGLARPNHEELEPFLQYSLLEALAQLRVENHRQRGLALEALALRVAHPLGLRHIATRVRGTNTREREADLVFEGRTLFFRRWQIQCNNAARLTVDDVAKEVGLLGYFGSDVGMVISTGKIPPQAVEFAKICRRSARWPIILLDGQILVSLAQDPAAVLNAIRAQAPEALIPA